jgi:ElaB/YqjD/DUF883 family membrane-anchored ribosome-binding protein
MARRNTRAVEHSVDDIVTEFRELAASIDELLAASGSEGSDVLAELKSKAADRLRQAKATIGNVERSAVQTARDVATKSDDYVHDNPWSSIAIGTGIGLVIGLLIGRR